VSLTQYYTATTLDGFIADPDNSLDWLFTRKREEDGPLNYEEFVAGVGAMAMGDSTRIPDHGSTRIRPIEVVHDIPCWRSRTALPSAMQRIEFTSADIATVHAERPALLAAGTSGSSAAETWSVIRRRGLLDEVIVQIAPVTLGAGAPLLPAGSSCNWRS
jgi:hypothetical protein